ncbi:hypothetical protein [Ornithinimicrobium kibberense]|uniref:hypothetical protein n=1 Tax=Ornithinimicrobium kibberense TaxID=282060 RepID=UPI00361B3571
MGRRYAPSRSVRVATVKHARLAVAIVRLNATSCRRAPSYAKRSRVDARVGGTQRPRARSIVTRVARPERRCLKLPP